MNFIRFYEKVKKIETLQKPLSTIEICALRTYPLKQKRGSNFFQKGCDFEIRQGMALKEVEPIAGS